MTSSTETPLRIAVVLGTTRPGRNGEAVAKWVLDRASDRSAATYELVDLADVDLPLLDEPVPAQMGQYTQEHTQKWAGIVSGYDGFVFLTPEYNHSTSGVLKNAFDYLSAEWNNKAAGFVSWGSSGGVRAVEHLRGIASELQIAHVRQQVAFMLAYDFQNYSEFTPAEFHDAEAATLFDQLEAWARAMRTVRQGA